MKEISSEANLLTEIAHRTILQLKKAIYFILDGVKSKEKLKIQAEWPVGAQKRILILS